MAAPLVLSAADTAELLRCSRNHVYDLVAEGVLATVPHMGRRVLIPRKAVEELIAQAEAQVRS